MIISIIVIVGVFIALTLAACAVINRDSSDDNNKCSGCPYKSDCKNCDPENNDY